MPNANQAIPSVSTFPPELLLEIFARIPNLKALITALGVDRTWRRLVPLASLDPHRRALLDLYLAAVNSPGFLATRRDITRGLVPLNREGWLCTLRVHLGCGVTLPETFTMWVREWPAKAVIGAHWPGLAPEWNEEDPIPKRRAWWRRPHEPSVLPLYGVWSGTSVPSRGRLTNFDLYAAHNGGSGYMCLPGSRAYVKVMHICEKPFSAEAPPIEGASRYTESMVVRLDSVKDVYGQGTMYGSPGPLQDGLHGTVHVMDDYYKTGSLAARDKNGEKDLKKPRNWIDFLRAELERIDKCFDVSPMSHVYKKRFREAASGLGSSDEDFWSDDGDCWRTRASHKRRREDPIIQQEPTFRRSERIKRKRTEA
ncbi:hypothetical protein PLICRDRAFT_177341 [Plicaturopsis crispa FD-325 SS-3]|nr:hypothetical protein PLICRDRAFT_177341 [Plicaturopsis crispa FD-325 SS-3]